MNYSSGQVSVFPGPDGPCYACHKGGERRRALLVELQGHEDPCWRKEEAIDAAGGVATTSLMASVVGALQVEVGLRRLQSAAPDARGVAYQVSLHPQPRLDTVIFEQSPTCPMHDPASIVSDVRECPDATSETWTPADVLDRAGAPDGFIAFDWPMTAKARCRTCQHEWEPLVRRARFRRQACPACGGRDLVEIEVLAGVDRQSPWARRTLSRLGLPAAHVYEIVARPGHNTRVHVEITGDLERVAVGEAR